MKSIKYILFLITLLYKTGANAQQPAHSYKPPSTTTNVITIYTPNNTPVTAYEWVSGDWTEEYKDSIKSYWLNAYNSITFIDEATCKYNCHAYAWAGRTNINPLAELK